MKRLAGTLVLLLAAAPAIAGGSSDGWTRSEVRRYYPSSNYRPSHDKPIQGWFEIRGGVYDAESTTKDDWTVGIKTSGQITPIVQLGFTTDLHRRENAGRTVTSTYTDPAGNVASVNVAGVCGIHVFWKRALGNQSQGLDPGPVIAAPSGGGTVLACHQIVPCAASGPTVASASPQI